MLWIPAYKDYWRSKVYILNRCLYSNWKTIEPRLKYLHNGLDVKVPLIFSFLIVTFNLCFHHQLLIKWVCIHIGQTHSRFPKCLWMHIKLASLMICTTNDNLTNTSSTLPPEVKKTVLYIAHIILYTQQKLSFIGNLRIKSLTCFKY